MRGRPKKEKPPIPSLKVLISRDDLISPEELSQALRVSQVTIYQWVRRGIFPSYLKLGALVRFEPQVIKCWLESNRRVAT
jgi:excisionase family DNA binding protein